MGKLSVPQIRMLENIAAGRSPNHGLTGRSAWGGASQTYDALARKGLVYQSSVEITPAGRSALSRPLGEE